MLYEWDGMTCRLSLAFWKFFLLDFVVCFFFLFFRFWQWLKINVLIVSGTYIRCWCCHSVPCEFATNAFYTLITEFLFLFCCLTLAATPSTANLPSRNGAKMCVLPGVTTIVWIGTCNGLMYASFNLGGWNIYFIFLGENKNWVIRFWYGDDGWTWTLNRTYP